MRASWRRLVCVCLAVPMLDGGQAAVHAADRAATADAAEEETKPSPFPPEAEEKFQQFLEKLKEGKRQACQDQMTKKIAEVVKVTGLSAESASALEPAGRQAAELGMKEDVSKVETLFRKQLGRQGEPLLDVIEQILAQADAYAKTNYFGGGADPTEQTVWKDALKKALNPAQAAAWQKAEDDAKEALDKQFADLLKVSVERTREQQGHGISNTTGQMKRVLGLAGERAKQLDDLAKSALDDAAKIWAERGAKMLQAMPEMQRRMIQQQGGFFFSVEEAHTPEKMPVWKDGLAKFLTPEERKTLQLAREERKARRVRALGKMLVALFDERVALTVQQREQLAPLAEKLVKAESGLFPQDTSEGYYDFGPPLFFTAGEKAKPEDLEKILDPLQRKRWTVPVSEPRSRSRVVMMRAARAVAPKKATAAKAETAEPEPEFVEQAISDFLFDKSETERKRTVSRMLLKAEDATRVASLAPEVTKRLQTAARGAAEGSLDSWRSMLEQNVRASTSEATPQNIKQRLESMEDYQFYQNRDEPPEKQGYWKKAVDSELTEPQRASWQKEVDARTTFRDHAIAAMIMAEFDRKNSLTAAQWTKLEELVTKFLSDYSTDISSMFSSGNSTPWYMESYAMFLPFAGIPEGTLKPILEKEQWDHWTGSNEFANVNNYWENVRQNHEQRLKLREK